MNLNNRIKEHLTKDDSSNYDYGKLVDNIESALIFETQPKCNKQKINSYTRLYDLRIINAGFKGILPKEICNRDH